MNKYQQRQERVRLDNKFIDDMNWIIERRKARIEENKRQDIKQKSASK